jgi:hypothetical protein
MGLTPRGTPDFELNLWCGICPAVFRTMADPETADLGWRIGGQIRLGEFGSLTGVSSQQ